MMWILPAAIAALSALPVGDRHAGKLTWNKGVHKLNELPTGLAPGTVDALALWSEWAAERDYRIVLSDDQVVLLLIHGEHDRAMEKVTKARLVMNDLAPPPQGPDVVQAAGSTVTPLRRAMNGSFLDSETIVLVQAKTQVDFESLLDQLAENHTYLAGWVQSAKRMSGVTLQRPLFGAWLAGGAGKQYSSANELVHRVAQLHLARGYEEQPYWVKVGFGWYTELEVQDCVRCFPYRSGFVFDTETAGYEARLKQLSRDVNLKWPPDMKRNSFDAEDAAVAWGTIAFLARYTPTAIPSILEALRVERHEGKQVEGSRWSMAPDYEVPWEDQVRIVREHIGPCYEEIKKFFAKGRRYRLPKKLALE